MRYLWAFFISLTLTSAYSSEDPTLVGKVTYLRGNVFVNNNKIDLQEKIYLNDEVLTEKKSVVKITFIDESIVTVAPESMIIIDEFKKKEKNLLTVLKGSLRAIVPKKASSKFKDKMILKTPTAAFGVRGTEFIVGHNQRNLISHVLTFSGVVNATEIKKGISGYENISNMISKRGISVTKGNMATLDISTKKFLPPIKIYPLQFHLIKKNKLFKDDKPKKLLKVKEQKIKINLNKKKLNIEENFSSKLKNKRPSTEMKNSLDGGFFDSKTGLYLPPDPNTSTYDPNLKIFVPGKEIGSVNPKTGAYKAPKGLTLEANGEFKSVLNNKQDQVKPTILTEGSEKNIKKVKDKIKKVVENNLNQGGQPPLPISNQNNGPDASNQLFQNQVQNNPQTGSSPNTKLNIRLRNND